MSYNRFYDVLVHLLFELGYLPYGLFQVKNCLQSHTNAQIQIHPARPKYLLCLSSRLIHSVVSNDSVSGQ